MTVTNFYLAIIIGTLISLLVDELFGIQCGGLIVPGYLAMVIDDIPCILLVFAISFIVYVIVNYVLPKFMILFGKRKFAVTLLLGIFLHRQDKRRVRHIGCKRFGVQFLLRGLYTHNDLLYFHTQLRNETNVPFDVDFVTFKIVDKKIVKRTAMQEQVIYPLRACNYVTRVDGKSSERTVFALPKFTIPEDKKLVVEMYEKQGGRHQMFEVDNEDLVRAEPVNELKVR